MDFNRRWIMPIARWYCQSCQAEVPLDHFATTLCGETTVHPDYAAAILWDRDSQHVKGAVRVTHGLGCPRRAVIEHVEDFAVDPLDVNAMLTGTAWHALMEQGSLERLRGWPSRESEVEVKGVLAGVEVRGKSDRLTATLVEDHKNINDDKAKYVRKDGVKAEHVAQLSIYAELAEQSGRPRPTKGIIWHHTSKAGKDALIPIAVKLMSVDEILEFKPHSGEYTVAELYKQADEGLKTGDWKSMPLAGKSMSFGPHSMCNYCTVRAICTEAETGAPW